MPIMINNLSGISPTITLAEIFAMQHHFAAAYSIYKFLAMTNPTEEVNSALKKMKEELLSISQDDKLYKLNEIFDEDEADKLGILPSGLFNVLQQLMDELPKKEDIVTSEVDIETDHQFTTIENRINSEWQEIIYSESGQKGNCFNKKPMSVEKIDWSKIKLSDFIEFLIGLRKKEQTLDELKLSEIMQAFLSQYSHEE